MCESAGKSRVHDRAIAIVAMPPATTAVTLPTSAATTPDSKAPSSFDALMNTISTAPTRPRSSFGVTSATVVERMFMLIMSTKPLTASAASESGRERERPKTTMHSAEDGDDHDQRRPRREAEGPAREDHTGDQGARRGRGAQDAETERADMEDRSREDGQQRGGAAEEHGEQVERDRPEQHPRPQHEADAGDEAVQAGRRVAGELANGAAVLEREHGDERAAEEHRGDDVHELGLEREDQPADGRPGDDRDLARDRAQRHRARQELGRDELRRERTEGGPAHRARDTGRRREHEERPDRVRPMQRDDDER